MTSFDPAAESLDDLVARHRRPAPDRPARRGRLAVHVALGLVAALAIRGYVAETFSIPSGSMERTLLVNDRVLVDKLSYDFGDIERGDVVVFDGTGVYDRPGEGQYYIKRVIGLPGDTVRCCDAEGRVTVNGKPLQEPYLFEDNHRPFGPIVVPAGHLFVMGDHRSDSFDSRDVGTVAQTAVVGKAELRVWPVGRLGWLSK